MIKLLRILVLLYLIFHFSSCIWFLLGLNVQASLFPKYISSINVTSGWIYEYYKGEMMMSSINYLSIYCASLYFVVSSFASVGFGDINSHNNPELALYTCFLLMCGVLLFSYFSGSIRKVIS